MFFGLATKGDLEKLREGLSGEVDSRIASVSRLGNSPEDVLRKIIERVDPREFLENILLSKGLTIEALVRDSVASLMKEKGADLVAGSVVDRVCDDMDTDRLYGEVADRISKWLLEDGKADLLEAVAEKLAEDAWDQFDYDAFYPIVGEKVVAKLAKG